MRILKYPGLVFRDSAGTHIELLILIELAHSCAVGAFHIVGIDFQLGLGLGVG